MFNSIRLKNFFSFQDTTIILEPGANILVGINGSGKSNLMKAIRLLREGISGSEDILQRLILDEWGGFDNISFSGKEVNFIQLSFEIDHKIASQHGFSFTHTIRYDINIHKLPATGNYYLKERLYQVKDNQPDFVFLDFNNGNGVIQERVEDDKKSKNKLIRYDDYNGRELVLGKVFDSERYSAANAIRKMLADITVYDYFDTTPSSRIRKPILPTSNARLSPNGSNLAQVLNTIKIQDKKTDRTIRDLLNQVNSNFVDYNFNFIGGNIELMLEEGGLNRAIHVSHISDGTLRFMCLLSVLLNPRRGQLICLDEPEVGLHPDMILTIAEAIKEAGSQSQSLIATHSEQLLNRFDLQEIRIVEKNDQNSTEVVTYTDADFADWYDTFLPGQMWRAGDLGGNRY
jgi:predicted ATPase